MGKIFKSPIDIEDRRSTISQGSRNKFHDEGSGFTVSVNNSTSKERQLEKQQRLLDLGISEKRKK